jgi:hypothetical protein
MRILPVAVLNPRKSNGGLGDLQCAFCKGNSSAYAVIKYENMDLKASRYICKSCLLKMVNLINEGILNAAKRGRI